MGVRSSRLHSNLRFRDVVIRGWLGGDRRLFWPYLIVSTLVSSGVLVLLIW